MIRISTTTLDQFRRVCTSEWANEAELVAQIKGQFKPNWQMQAGTAWHTLLADAKYYPGDSDGMPRLDVTDGLYNVGGYTFSINAMLYARQFVGPGICEVKATRIFPSIYGPATVVAQADHVHGLLIQDHKAKFSTIDVKDYESSLQWRMYLLVHGAAAFRYNLFAFREPDEGYCELKDILSCRFWPYEAMYLECLGWINDFVAWADANGLMGFLDREGSSISYAEAA